LTEGALSGPFFIMTIKISACTPKYLPQIKVACEKTFEDHRKRQPFAFAENAFEHTIKAAFEVAFIPFDKNFAPTSQTPTDVSENLFIAHLNGEPAGYILFDLTARPQFIDVGTLYISDICVFDAFQNQGVGRALLQFAKDLCDTQKRDNLSATVWAGNTASANLFQNCGFEVMNQDFRYGPTTQKRPNQNPKPPASTQPLYPAWMFWCAILGSHFIAFIIPKFFAL